MRTELHVEYHGTVNKLFLKYGPSTLGIDPQYAVYKPKYDDEVSVLDLIRKSKYTKQIKDQDLSRDTIYRGFSNAVKAGLSHYNADKKAASYRVDLTVSHYGNIARKPIDQKTAAIDDMLRELTDSNSDDIVLLGLGEWLTHLNSENSKFRELMSARYKEASLRPTIHMKDARKEVDKAFRAILDMLDALILVHGDEQYSEFILEMNAVSDRYKNQMLQSEGRRKAIKDVKAEPETVEEDWEETTDVKE
jgi:hypothetical protein